LVVMLRQHSEIVRQGNLGRVPHPPCKSLNRVPLSDQVRLATRPHSVEGLGPHRKPRPGDRLFERRAEIAVAPTAGTVGLRPMSLDDVHRLRRRLLARRGQRFYQFWKWRNHGLPGPRVMFGLWARYRDPFLLPVDIDPAEAIAPKTFTSTQPTVSTTRTARSSPRPA